MAGEGAIADRRLIINADDLDAALAWAGKVVHAIDHPIEVRPFFEMPGA